MDIDLMTLLMFGISIFMVGYGIYVYMDQKQNLRFTSKKSKYTPLIAFIIVLVGAAIYFLNGRGIAEIAGACVLVAFALGMLLTKNGMGESGIYTEGIRIAWKQIKRIDAVEKQGNVTLRYVQRNAEKTLELENAKLDEVNRYLKKLRKIEHFGK